jgi:lipid II:glycine glycyltransferase (peptidoglycan interpeptide bridge formation enzyme)
MERQNWEILKIRQTQILLKKIPVLGYFAKIHRPETITETILAELKKRRKIFQIVVEPKTESDAENLKKLGFKLVKVPYIPSKTLEVDLNNSLERILLQMKKDGRYSIRKSKGITIKTIKTAKEIEEFRTMWRKILPIKRYVPSTKNILAMKETFGEKCLVLFAPEMQAGGVFIRNETICYYWHGFTGEKGRQALVQYAIVWKAITWAKKLKMKIFDFEGLYDERFPNEAWKGFTHFKKSFGGKEILYPGCYSKINNPIIKMFLQ